MKNRQFGRSGIRVSELCLGTMTFGRESDEQQSDSVLNTFIDAGGNFLDTANSYGNGASEEILGRLIKGKRDNLIVATKCRLRVGPGTNDIGASRRHIRMSVESSLRRLQTDWIDLFQMHAWDPKTPIEETWSTLNDLVTAGTVRYLGVSQYAAWQIAQTMGVAALHGWESLVSVQPEYSLVSRGAERELLPLARQSNLAVMPWSPLGGGILTGKYRPGEAVPEDSRAAQASPAAGMVQDRLSTQVLVLEQVQRTAAALEKTAAQVALNWVLDSPGVTSPVVGARTVEQLQQNLGAVGWVMPVAERAALDDASALQVDYPESAMQALGLRVY